MALHTYVILIRGINVGGKNKVSMAELKQQLESIGFQRVVTYIQSGNVIVQTPLDARAAQQKIEAILARAFKLDGPQVKVLALTHAQLKAIVDSRPKGFGDAPDKYHSDAIFLIDVPMDDALAVFRPREGVDAIWPGQGVVYSQRLSELRTKSRLSSIVGTVPYQSMTIRSWSTTTKLLALLDQLAKDTTP